MFLIKNFFCTILIFKNMFIKKILKIIQSIKKSLRIKNTQNAQNAQNTKKIFSLSGNVKENHVQLPSNIILLGDNAIKFFWKSHDNSVTIGDNFTAKNLKIHFKGHHNQLIIDDNVTFTGHILIAGNNRIVKIGSNTSTKGVYILSREADVTIGQDCLLSREIEIRSSDVHKIYEKGTKKHLNPSKPVIIGNHVWIGAKVLISKGAIIPNDCVIGATSFINKVFTEENTVIAGIPAKVVKHNISWVR